jgi:hypothetical protein
VVLGEALGLSLTPAQVLIAQSLLLGAGVPVAFGVGRQEIEIAGAEEFAGRQRDPPPVEPRPFAEPRGEIIEASKLVSAMLRDERIEGGALGVGRLPIGQTDVKRFVKHPGNGGEGRSADRVQATFIVGREEEGRGRRLAEAIYGRNADRQPSRPVDRGADGEGPSASRGLADQRGRGCAEAACDLDERIEQAPDEAEKGKLRRLRDSVVDIGESVTAEVLVKLMTG